MFPFNKKKARKRSLSGKKNARKRSVSTKRRRGLVFRFEQTVLIVCKACTLLSRLQISTYRRKHHKEPRGEKYTINKGYYYLEDLNNFCYCWQKVVDQLLTF
jgi:hypothetical protein